MKSNKYVKRRLYKSVRKLRSSRIITLDCIQIAKNMIDPFAKRLSPSVNDNPYKEMGLRPM